MGKGSWRRPNGPGFDLNFCKNFPDSRGCERERLALEAFDKLDEQKRERQERADHAEERANERAKRLIALTLDELRTIVFETSVAYAQSVEMQEAEWNRAAALKNALSALGYERESEMIGGAA
jgi:hypothetical protein